MVETNVRHSAGIIPFRIVDEKLEFFVGHPGGPFWKGKNYWALLKGGIEEGEDILEAAVREFREESGITLPEDVVRRLSYIGTVRQNSRKNVSAFAVECPDIEPDRCHSILVEGKDWPEIDGYKWMGLPELKECTNQTNVVFYETIETMCSNRSDAK
jgi:predicted NUDIX family NTP pyrophosphohydrolase